MNFDIFFGDGNQAFAPDSVILRAIFALITSLLVTFLIGKRSIAVLKKLQKHGQPIREDGPKSHITEKAGTPTMGGIIIIFCTLVGATFWGNFYNKYLILCILSLLGFGALGFLDDYKKLKHRSSGGIRAKPKFAIQLMLAFILVWCVVKMGGATYLASSIDTSVVFPSIWGSKKFVVDIGIFYYLFASLVIVGASNAVNLTDGLDGLATLPVALSTFCFGIFAFIGGIYGLSQMYNSQHVINAYEVLVFASALIGACIGFLWYNKKPAQIFMGDIGSLSLGAAIGLMAVITKREIALLIVGGLFVIETVSVMIQVSYFKMTGGKRFFKMTPLHHHFEKMGWPERKVVARFWALAFICMVLGFITL